jgi:hypothetical protein
MKTLIFSTRFRNCGLLWAGLFFAASAVAQTNAEHRTQLIKNVQMARTATTANAARFGYVPTNTAAFCEYALEFLLKAANTANTQLNLGLPQPITSDHVTQLRAVPMTNGWDGGITVLDRYAFGVTRGEFSAFFDYQHWWRGLERDFSRQQQLAQQATPMTTNQALKIALGVLAKLGLSEKALGLTVPAEVQQYMHEPPEPAKPQPLPLFEVRWPAGRESQMNDVEMQIAALTTNIVSYRNWVWKPAPLPTNYFKMLGVSTNFAEWGTNYGYAKQTDKR